MTSDNTKIAESQLFLLIIGFIFGSSVILLPGQSAGHDAWLAISLGLIEGLVIVFLFSSIAEKFPGKNLCQILNIIYGPFLGKLFSLCYIWYFFHLGSLVLRNFGNFFVNVIISKTPFLVIIIFVTIICASAVRNGIEVIARCSNVLVPLIIITFLLITFMLLNNITIELLLPVMDISLKELLRVSHSSATFPFGETIVFLMIFGNLNDYTKIKKTALKSVFFAGVIFILNAATVGALFGNSTSNLSYPSYSAIRLIHIGEFLTRMELIVVISFFTMGFLKVTVLYYGIVTGTAYVLKLKSYLPLILPMGMLMIILAFSQIENPIENFFFAYEIYPYYAIPFQILFPLLTLLLSLKQKKTIGGT